MTTKARFTLQNEVVGELVIADPPLNLFGLELARDLARATDEARESKARAILVRAEGENFSAGANVEIFVGRDELAARALIEEFMPVIRRFAEIPIPTVAAGSWALPCGGIGGRSELRPDLGGGGNAARPGRGGYRGDAVWRRDTTTGCKSWSWSGSRSGADRANVSG